MSRPSWPPGTGADGWRQAARARQSGCGLRGDACCWSHSIWVGCLLVACLAGAAQAHRVNVFAYADGDSIRVESRFAGGRACRRAQVRLLAPDGRHLGAGITNDEGLLALSRPAVDAAGGQPLLVVVDAGGGHQTQLRLEATELWPPPASVAPTLPDEFEAAVDAVVERRLAPVMQTLRALERGQARTTFRDAVGGVGYIIGLLGAYSYLRGRRR